MLSIHGEYLRKLGLNERQIKAVDHIKENKIINLSSYKSLIKATKHVQVGL